MVDITFFEEKTPHYKSKSGSLYLYSKDGVFRYSNHWGRVANCRWKIKGVEDYKNQNYYVGYTNWSGFHPLNSSEKLFYLEVDSINEVKIVRVAGDEEATRFLMTLDLANKRLKEIKVLYKDYKWATYYDEDVDNVRNVLVEKLINSDTPLKDLKISLRQEFN